MKKSMKSTIAKQLIEGIKKGIISVDRDGMVMRGKKILKRKLSKYILLRMTREGARLSVNGFYKVGE